MKIKSWQITATLVLLVLGILLSVQFRTQQNFENSLISQSTEDLVAMWKNLDKKQVALQQEISELKSQKELLTLQSQAGQNDLSNIQQEIEKLKMVSGQKMLEGPGITLTITEDSQLLYLDLIDIVNELWASGAEAIAINDQRVTFNTAFWDTERDGKIVLLQNGRQILYPIVIKAVGDPQTLEKGLTFPGGLIDNLETLYSIYPQINVNENIIIPAEEKPDTWLYARIVNP